MPSSADNASLVTSPSPSATAALVAANFSAPASKKTYLVGLDALRAVAALSVCLFHYTNGMLPKLVVPTAKVLFSKGYLGVDIFFVISGFIIPYSLVGKNHQVAGMLTYLKKRVLRINPPAYICILLILAQWFLVDYFINHNTQYTGSLSWGQLISNLLFTIPFTQYAWINGVFWTLAIEFQFYLFIGLLFNLLFGRSAAWFTGVYLIIAALALLPHTASVGFLHYSSLFALGGVALLWQQHRLSWPAYIAGLLLFGALTWGLNGLNSALLGVGTAVAVNALRVQIPGLTFLGKFSYSFYLMHGLIGTTAEFVLIKLLPPHSNSLRLLLTITCVVLALCGSYLFYRLVEQPLMRFAAQNRR